MRLLGWSAFVIVGLAMFLIFLLNPAEAVPEGVNSRKFFQSGPYGIQLELFEVEDSQRKTPANGKYSGAPSRTLSGKLWRPYAKANQGLQEGAYPFVVYSHGFMSFHHEGAYIAEFLASHGYVVVAVDFPLTNYFAPGGPNLADVINQPGDVSFIIDRVLERNKKQNDSLYQQVDESRIGLMGLSLGGMTTELAIFDPRMKDDRVRAAVSIAGPSHMFTEKFFNSTTVSFMIIAGDADAIVPYEYNAKPIREKDPDSVLVTITGASHAAFSGIAAILFRWVNNPDSVGCASMKGKVELNSSPFDALIDETIGVVKSERVGYCENYNNLPRAMRPAQQQMLTVLATYSFFESLFNADATRRVMYATYLQQTFPNENPEVNVDAGNYRAAY